MSGELDGKCALVTGGARGLGRALCEALGRAGARVALTDFRAELAAQTCDALREKGLDVMHFALDVRDAMQIEERCQAIRERCGDIDILINCAAVDYTLPIDELTIDQWDDAIATNLRAPFLLSRCVAATMKARQQGDIVNITSTAAKRAWPNASAYHASKWALLGLSHALHAELRPYGIRVIAVVAGGMRTPFLLDRFPDIDPALLQPPENVADMIVKVLTMPRDSVVPEISVLPMRETSWP